MIDDLTFSKSVLSAGLITFGELRELEQLAKAKNMSRFDAALSTKTIPEHRLMELTAELYGMPLIHLGEVPLDRDWLLRLPRRMIEDLGVVALGPSSEAPGAPVQVAMVNPHDVDAIEAVGEALNAEVIPVLVGLQDLHQALERVFGRTSITRPTSVVPPVPEEATDEVDLSSLGSVERTVEREALPDMKRTRRNASITRQDSSADGPQGFDDVSTDRLVRAAVDLLIERRIFSASDLRKALKSGK